MRDEMARPGPAGSVAGKCWIPLTELDWKQGGIETINRSSSRYEVLRSHIMLGAQVHVLYLSTHALAGRGG